MRPLTICCALLFALPAAAQGPTLVAHYKLDEALGATSLAESSGQGSAATPVGSVRLGQTGADVGTNTCADFNLVGTGHATFPDGPNMTNLRNDLTVSAWINPESYGPLWPTRILSNDSSSWSCGIMNGSSTASGLRFTTLGILDYDLPGVLPPLDEWTHLAFVMDANNDVTFYMNGVNVGMVSGISPSNAPSPTWVIGGLRVNTTPHEFFDGKIDDLQVYAGSLTDEDVAFIFANPGATLSGSGSGNGYCFGDGGGTACPCGNSSATGGCANGSGVGATLTVSGQASLSTDTLVLSGTGLIPSQPGLYFQGNNAVNAGSGVQFGDGLRCAGGGVIRLQVRFASGAGDSATTISVSAAGLTAPGDVKRYQLWYRDPVTSPCGAQFNLSNGVEVTWGP